MKTLYTILFIAFMGLSYSQSIILTSPTTVTDGLLTPPNTDVTNDTIIYCVNDLTSIFVGGIVYVINNTASAMDVKVKRFADQYACFVSNQFCWTICYNEAISVSPDPINIVAYDTSIAFHGYMKPNGTEGCCFIKYRFFNSADTTVYSDVTIKYCFADVCSEDVGNEEFNSSKISIYPNPAEDQFILTNNGNVEFSGFKYSIINMQGQVIETGVINGDNLNFDISTIATGLYILNINGEHFNASKRFIKK